MSVVLVWEKSPAPGPTPGGRIAHPMIHAGCDSLSIGVPLTDDVRWEPLTTNERTPNMHNYLDDKRLSFRAKGVLTWLLDHSDQPLSPGELALHATEGVTATRTAVVELIDFGYVRRTRRHNDDGTFSWTHTATATAPEAGQ